MAIEAELIGGLPELSVIAGAVHVVAVKAGDPSAIHHRLHKIVALHAILVCGAAADIPLSHLLGVNVVADRVAAIAKRSGRTVHIVGRIKRSPPIATGRRYLILAPLLIYDLPLHGQWEIVIADFRKVTLFPNTAIDKCNPIFGELVDKHWSESHPASACCQISTLQTAPFAGRTS